MENVTGTTIESLLDQHETPFLEKRDGWDSQKEHNGGQQRRTASGSLACEQNGIGLDGYRGESCIARCTRNRRGRRRDLGWLRQCCTRIECERNYCGQDITGLARSVNSSAAREYWLCDRNHTRHQSGIF